MLQCAVMFNCCILRTCVGGGGCYNVLSCLTVAYMLRTCVGGAGVLQCGAMFDHC